MPALQNSKETLAYLGTIGTTDRGDDIKLNNSLKALVELGGFLIDTARANLDKKGNVASGKTSESMRIVGLIQDGTNYELPIELLSTYKFLNYGVKGTEGGRGKYSFKTSRPSAKMAKSILRWLKTRGIASKYKAISKTERKNQRLKKVLSEAKSRERLSYAMAASIKKKGIEPTYFLTRAIEATKREQKKKYANALKMDIIEALNQN